jgi:glycosyltransferase involved in cell wall biosynthesis
VRHIRKLVSACIAPVGLVVEYLISEPALVAAVKLGPRMSARRREAGKIRTLWGVTPILTLPLKAKCDRALGFESDSLVLTNYHITNQFTWNLKWTRLLVHNSRLEGAVLKVILAIVLLRYDVIHYFADRGILPPLDEGFGIHPKELDAINRAGKAVYVFTYGADVRTRRKTLALGDWNFCRDCNDPGRYCICDDDRAVSIMSYTGQHIRRFVAMGDMLEYVPDPVHLAFWPIDFDKIRTVQPLAAEAALKILHAPNHTHFKGTRYLERAVDELRQVGVAIDLVKISGVSNQTLMEKMAEVDLVVDQLIGGAFGYTALEAMAHGKPVITYIRHKDLVVGFDECPLLNATPDDIKDVLAWCSANRERLRHIGKQGRAYIEKYHSIPAVAARLAKLYCESMTLSPRLAQHFSDFQKEESRRAGSIEQLVDWRHDWVPSEFPRARLTAS